MRYSVPTHWNSVYLMITQALKLLKAINIYITADESKDKRLLKFKMSELEWDQLEAVLAILHPFAKASIKMQATTKPGLGDVFCVYKTLFDTLDQMIESL